MKADVDASEISEPSESDPLESGEIKRARGRGKTEKGYLRLFNELEHAEKLFVRELLKSADFELAASKAGHRTALELLARKRVRNILLSAVVYHPNAAAILKPYIMQSLVSNALQGNANCAKILLSMSNEAKPKRSVSYATSEASKTASRRASDGLRSNPGDSQATNGEQSEEEQGDDSQPTGA